jgi:hypothetical protein
MFYNIALAGGIKGSRSYVRAKNGLGEFEYTTDRQSALRFTTLADAQASVDAEAQLYDAKRRPDPWLHEVLVVTPNVVDGGGDTVVAVA